MDVLIIDDELAICEALEELLTKEGFSCAYEVDPRDGVARLAEAGVLLLDLRLPGVEDLGLLEEVCKEHPRVPVIMITAHGTIRTAVDAMKRGAFDFIVKPPERDELVASVKKALRAAEREQEVSALYYETPEEVVFRDDASCALLDQVRQVAPSDLVVLLEGETGVGKEVFARLLHEWSPRGKHQLVKINCAAIPEALFESELFGHEKGAFTGASVSKPGRVELAQGGTLFLDEIGELSAPAQAKLLQFLQDRTFERVGGLRTQKADVRLVAATNRDLEEEVERSRFRRDLYFRIAGVVLTIPPLRERRADIGALVDHFLPRFNTRYKKTVRLSDRARDALVGHEWTGNVRELEQVMERGVALAKVPVLEPEHLLPVVGPAPAGGGTLRESKNKFEQALIVDALASTNGNRTAAAKILGISRRMLHKKLKQFEIS